jgi:hypothetical protein
LTLRRWQVRSVAAPPSRETSIPLLPPPLQAPPRQLSTVAHAACDTQRSGNRRPRGAALGRFSGRARSGDGCLRVVHQTSQQHFERITKHYLCRALIVCGATCQTSCRLCGFPHRDTDCGTNLSLATLDLGCRPIDPMDECTMPSPAGALGGLQSAASTRSRRS